MNARLPGDISESDLFMQRGCAEKTLPIENNENRIQGKVTENFVELQRWRGGRAGDVAGSDATATQLDKLEE